MVVQSRVAVLSVVEVRGHSACVQHPNKSQCFYVCHRREKNELLGGIREGILLPVSIVSIVLQLVLCLMMLLIDQNLFLAPSAS